VGQEHGAAAEEAIPLVRPKVDTEAEVQAIAREVVADEAAAEAPEDEVVNEAAEADAVVVEDSTRPKDHLHQRQRHQQPATLNLSHSIIVRHFSPKVNLLRTSS